MSNKLEHKEMFILLPLEIKQISIPNIATTIKKIMLNQSIS